MPDEFLSRWSRRKHEARRVAESGETAEPAPSGDDPAPRSSQGAMPAPPEPAPLPSVESLTTGSDFSPFMREEVDPGVRRQALRTLFADERFNVMDGLDVYIDDYSKPDPLPADWLGKLGVLARLGHEPDPQPADPDGKPVATGPVTQGPALPESVAPTQVDEPPKTIESAGEFAPPSDTSS